MAWGRAGQGQHFFFWHPRTVGATTGRRGGRVGAGGWSQHYFTCYPRRMLRRRAGVGVGLHPEDGRRHGIAGARAERSIERSIEHSIERSIEHSIEHGVITGSQATHSRQFRRSALPWKGRSRNTDEKASDDSAVGAGHLNSAQTRAQTRRAYMRPSKLPRHPIGN